MLKIKDLNLTVHHQPILQKMTIDFQPGNVYGIIGPNGVGKTTLFKSILGITRYAGTITVNGQPVSDAKVGKLIEYPNFYQKLTVQQNLNLYAQYIGVQQSAITEILKKVSLNNARNMPFQSLSLGMKQRLGIARALMGNKQVLLLDEPQNGLDPLGIRAVRNLLNDPEIRRNKIILLASHNLNEISRIVDKIVFVNKGEIICCINNLPHANYDVYQKLARGTTLSDSQWQVSQILGTDYWLSTQSSLRFQAPLIGTVTSLENLFDFVITGEVAHNVNFN
ncbi:ATP-binding cassette domain-containing protein [Lentilactobacillus parafarraginis]|jgi:ABC-type multidrug transport system ATPase subunit|uniref:Mutacin ABC transporter, ATP-binding protein MutF family protein n=2 Tax=Lentilactobacillus parafarraginis TaxID=390842 RepID=A0A0R1YXK3_9LACO|nr:ATP-binding cassette domain-containing protein [Lentilactobacillus parafarraginis]KRM44374.1 mutacin ABC transporter, ATP-binding protein MutF family protein [Lentilactobacillus parafarraginis DSM 18390 = JCM 14109]TLQ18608.1 ATP-binding cassette domain-containing protein [Lentilactobacillus parafarraginis]